ncbi:hypothetical protein DBR09_04120 [Aeromonas sp. HMWF016]|nr:hypothetical protein DBR09_04120 [Aeromonas sp. HMWF016]
MTRKRGRPRKQ